MLNVALSGVYTVLERRLRNQQVLAVLREAVAAAPGADAARTDAFRLQSTREIDGSATTFHRDKPALLRRLPALEADFGAWGDAFGGMALHELR
jgi:hypothetical protein